ncbi:MAG TPA: hypothetical protein P5555_14590 [Candidatus Paceibacterota bacterium]|nr:hypothetical protein [Verrucomicrobiota bacterium]HRZ46409.1 hypothetical protein [Candidatus Paceibacterota bacterium]
MTRAWIWSVCLWIAMGAAVAGADAVAIRKVLPHYLDLQGRHALHPSLYERDAYQAHLRQNPAQCGGIRFDIQSKGRPDTRAPIYWRIELRTDSAPNPRVFEKPALARTRSSRWSQVTIDGEDYRRLGKIMAWRVTLVSGDRVWAEQKSFLWQ